MSGLAKFMKSRAVVLILLIMAVLAVGLMYNYGEKFTASESMETSNGDAATNETENIDEAQQEAPVDDSASQNPSDLLPDPISGSNGWDVLDTVGTSSGANPDLLEAGHHAGIDTVGQTLRNANLQVRSDPQIPIVSTGPWNQTTIDATNIQVPFNLGS